MADIKLDNALVPKGELPGEFFEAVLSVYLENHFGNCLKRQKPYQTGLQHSLQKKSIIQFGMERAYQQWDHKGD